MNIVKLYKTISDNQMSDIIQDQLRPKRFRISDSEYVLYSIDELHKFIDQYPTLDPISLLSKEKRWTQNLNSGFGFVSLFEFDANFFVDIELTVWIVKHGKIYIANTETDLAII